MTRTHAPSTRRRLAALIPLGALAVALAAPLPAAAQQKFVTIGTGGVTG
ncbi:MAG: C4-dicarboxylate ABC transporter substrate-binding protein, partial [Caldimonas sp.]